MQDRLLTIDELAAALGGLGRASIYRHTKALPDFPQPIKVGAATRVPRIRGSGIHSGPLAS